MAHLRLVRKDNLSSFRRIALGTWSTTKDPSIYGQLTLRADKMMAHIEDVRARTGQRLTLSHVMAKCLAKVMFEVPEANAILRFNRIYLRQDIGVFFQVALEDKVTGDVDLSGATLFDCHLKSLADIVTEFEVKVGKVRSGKDKELEGTRSSFKKIPFLLLGWVLDAMSFFLYTLNWDMSKFGMPRDPFGSVMITNIGSLGLDEGYVPLVPYSRVPLVIALGALKDEVVVEGGVVTVAKVLRLCATIDHRVLDGLHAAKMNKILQRIFADPAGEL